MKLDMQEYFLACSVKVRFVETDANGHMSHLSPVIYMEQARTELVLALGMGDLAKGETFFLAKQSVEYKKQAYFYDTIDIYCRVASYSKTTLEIEYVMVNQKDEIIVTAAASFVYYDANKQRVMRLPQDLQERIDALKQKPLLQHS